MIDALVLARMVMLVTGIAVPRLVFGGLSLGWTLAL